MCVWGVEICLSFEKFITNFSLRSQFTISAEGYSKSASLSPSWLLNPDKCLPRLRPTVDVDEDSEGTPGMELDGAVAASTS